MDKAAMRDFSYGLFVLTAREDGRDNGCIINTAIQATTDPNRVIIAVNKQNLTHDMILRTRAFNLSLLSEQAGFPLFQRFGFQSGRDADKFEGLDTPRTATGIRYIPQGTTAWLSCWVEQTVDLGTHTLFIAAVTDGEKLSKEPPMTYAYYHAHVKPQPQKTEKHGWRCKVCGYIHESETLPDDFVCPICKHGPDDFEKI